MIFFKMAIDNPWFRHRPGWQSRDYLCKVGSITQHKHWELQFTRWEPDRLVRFALDLCWRGDDHAGPSLHLEIYGFMFCAKIYDGRHWNYKKSRWYLPGEEQAEYAE